MVDTSSQRRVGAGRVLVVVYGFFVLASGARAVVQIVTQFSVAPLAYTLSGAAAVVYTVGLVLLLLADRGSSRREARAWCRLELAAVCVIGLLTVVWPAGFTDQTVWSDFGRGYWFVPLALPVAALLWLHRSPVRAPSSAPGSTGRRAPSAH